MIACTTVVFIAIPELNAERQNGNRNFLDEMKEGFFALRENKGLFALLMIGTLYMFVYMPINALYPLISMDYFSGTPIHVSITEIAYASGALPESGFTALFQEKIKLEYLGRVFSLTGSIISLAMPAVPEVRKLI